MTFNAISRPLIEVKIIGSTLNGSIATQIRPDVDTQQTLGIARDHELSDALDFSLLCRNLKLNDLGMEFFAFPC